jgi:hypothetical protein
LRVNLLSFFTDGPANPEECGIGMRGSLHHHRRAADFAHTFGHERLNRRAFFHAYGKMVRVAGKTNGALTGHEELGQLRMAAMKLHLIGGNSLEQIDRLFIVIVFSFGKPDEHLVVARLAHDAVFPFGFARSS